MAGEQKRKAREVLVTKALLLGYTIEPYSSGGYMLKTPTGEVYRIWSHKNGYSNGPFGAAFPAQWRAAQKALELAGVLDAKKP